MLLAGVPRADAAAVVAVETEGGERRATKGTKDTEARHQPLPTVPLSPAPASPPASRLALGPAAGDRDRLPAQPGPDSRIGAAAAERAARLARRRRGRHRIVHRQRHLRLGLLHARAGQGVPRLGALRGRAVQRRADRPDALLRSDRPPRGREVHRVGGRHAQLAAADAAAWSIATPRSASSSRRWCSTRWPSKTRRSCWPRAKPRSRSCSATCAASRASRSGRRATCWGCCSG